MIYAGLQVLYGSIWLIFAYRVAGFGLGSLGILLRDAIVSLGLATIVMGGFHLILHGWVAFLPSTISALCMSGFAFFRYVRKGRAPASRQGHRKSPPVFLGRKRTQP